MTTLGTHPFVPGASKLGAPIPCQRCTHDAAHPVHDWLSHTASWWTVVLAPITPEEMVQLPNLLTADGGR
jgi:hypothetical protein